MQPGEEQKVLTFNPPTETPAGGISAIPEDNSEIGSAYRQPAIRNMRTLSNP